MTDLLGLDVSNFNDLAALLANMPEAERVVVRCSLERESLSAITRAQCALVRGRGLGLDTYVWAYATSDDPSTLAGRAQALVGEYTPDIYWIDCEEDTRPGAFKSWTTDAATNIAWLTTAVQGFREAGLRVGIYSGFWFFTAPQWLANTTNFSALPLWNATDAKTPDRSIGWPYGGWQPPYAVVQYDLSGPDRDCFDGALYETGGADLSQAERDELAQFRQDQPYYDTLLGSKDAPGGLIAAALDQMVQAAGTSKTHLAAVVREQAASVRQAAGL